MFLSISGLYEKADGSQRKKEKMKRLLLAPLSYWQMAIKY